MIYVLICHSTWWLGYEISKLFLPKYFDIIDGIALGAALGIPIVSWIFLIIRYFVELTIPIGITVSVICYIVSYLLHLFFPRKQKVRSFYFESIIVYSIGLLILITLGYSSFLRKGIFSAGTTYSDLPVHLGIITSYAYGDNKRPDFSSTPFYFGHTLRYPIIPDFYSSVLISCGNASIRVAYALPSVMIFTSALISIHTFSNWLIPTRYIPELTLILFYFATGNGWKWILRKICNNHNANFAHNFCLGDSTYWIHTIIHFFLPQRSGLFSFPLDVYIIILLNYITDSNYKSRKIAFFTGFVMGLIPMISAHSYIATGEYAIFACLLRFPWKNIKDWLRVIIVWAFFGFTSIIMAIPQVIHLTGILSSRKREMMSIEPIWHEANGLTGISGFFTEWWRSLGPVFIIAVFGWPFIIGKRQKHAYLPSFILFWISNFIRYQPGAMDNTKVHIVGWYIFACPIAAYFFLQLFRDKNVRIKRAAIFVLFLTCIGGVFAVAKGHLPTQFLTPTQRRVGQWFAQFGRYRSDPLAGPWHSNSLMSIGGRSIFMSFPGWVWTHGLDYESRREKREMITHDPFNMSLYDEENISYVILNKNDDENFKWEIGELYREWVEIWNHDELRLYRRIDIPDDDRFSKRS